MSFTLIQATRSSLGDRLKLLEANIPVRKAVVIFGYEHSPAQVSLDPAISAFELIALKVLAIELGPRHHAKRGGLVHPVHQVLRVFGYEVLGQENEKGVRHYFPARGVRCYEM